MGKISPVAAKYIVHLLIHIDGVVEKPDIIGAVFGQTEGLLGSDLELRELQVSGRIGRIEVDTEVKGGRTDGTIIIPSSLDKVETAIVAAALETIQRIGPCNAKVKVDKLEDVRISKRAFILQRAKQLLEILANEVLPDSQELMNEVEDAVRVMGIVEYGKDRLPAGPDVDENEEVIVVEGRADVLNLLKNNIKNVIALNGTKVPQTIIELSRKKTVTLFVDGDRGGDLIVKEAASTAEIDFVAKAPDGKEVEELSKKEINKALRARVSAEQANFDIKYTSANEIRDSLKDVAKVGLKNGLHRNMNYDGNGDFAKQNFRGQQFSQNKQVMQQVYGQQHEKALQQSQQLRTHQHMGIKGLVSGLTAIEKQGELTNEIKKSFREKLEELFGTRGAYIIDDKLMVLGKVPVNELTTTINELGNVFAVVFDGILTKSITENLEKVGVKYAVATSSNVKQPETRVNILTGDMLK